jgi:hypothetical protein
MNNRVSRLSDLSLVTERLDHVLCSASYDNDVRRKVQIALAFCELLASHLDERQSEAVAVAKRVLASGEDPRHAEMIEEFARRTDVDQRMRTPAQRAALNRLIFSALNKNTGLSSDAGDFLIGLGTDAGLAANQMASVFAELVPGFEPEE